MKKTALALAIASAATLVNAQDSNVETLVVTASRTSQTIDTTMAPVTVYERADIQRLQATDLSNLLARSAGVSLVKNGGPGSQASVILRGNASDHALVLLDGQRISSATSGAASLQFIDPAQIERIEIVRGPRSSLYGSDAIGGVIQIFTTQAQDGKKLSLSTSLGNNNTRAHTGSFAVSGDNVWGGIRLSHFDTDGIDNTTDKSGFKADDDAYTNTSGSLNAGAKLGRNTVAFDYNYVDTETHYDGSPLTDPFAEGLNTSANLSITTAATDTWTSTVRLGYVENESSNYESSTGARTSQFDTTREQISWQNDVKLNEQHLLSIGADYYADEVEASDAFTENRQENSGLFVQYQGQLGAVDVLAGLRRSDNQAFGKNDTGNLSLGYDVDESLRFILSYGTAFKAPTFNDLYFPAVAYSCPGIFCYMYQGNADLAPEESENYELEIRRDLDNGGISVNIFDSEVENLIVVENTFSAAGTSATPANVDNANIRGVELSMWKTIGAWTVEGSLTQQKPSDASTGNILRRRPRQIASLNADTQIGAVQFGISVKGQGASFDDAANTERLAGFATVDLRFAVDLSEELSLKLKLGNIFNKEYATALDFSGLPYASEGSSSLLTLSYTPQLD